MSAMPAAPEASSVNEAAPAPPGRSDIALLYTARGLRGFGDGFAVIVLPAYMSAIGYGSIDIGIVAAASLAGSAVLTLAVGLIAPRHDLRHLLLLAAGLMMATAASWRLHRSSTAPRDKPRTNNKPSPDMPAASMASARRATRSSVILASIKPATLHAATSPTL